jgi:hypothetical protein
MRASGRIIFIQPYHYRIFFANDGGRKKSFLRRYGGFQDLDIPDCMPSPLKNHQAL